MIRLQEVIKPSCNDYAAIMVEMNKVVERFLLRIKKRGGEKKEIVALPQAIPKKEQLQVQNVENKRKKIQSGKIL